MIIKASQRGGARNLANHLTNTHDNDHVTVQELRGLAGQSLHAALLEIDAVSQGTQCQQPLFSVSFNPPMNQDISFADFNDAFEQLEKKLGLDNQPRAVVYHEKEGRRHAHVVWSRIDIGEMKAIRMSHFKQKCKDVSRDLYIQHGWEMPKGLQKAQDRDPFDLSNTEWQLCKRRGVDPKAVKKHCQEAWSRSDNRHSFQHALAEKGLFLCRGDRRGFVVLDHERNVFSLSRYGGIKTKALTEKLGSPDNLPSVDQTKQKIRSIYNADALERIRELKEKHVQELKPLQDQKQHIIKVQRAERRELQDQQRVKRNIVLAEGRKKLRKGVRGLFDKITGRHQRVSLVSRKEQKQVKQQQVESRQKMIFRHNQERAVLQKSFTNTRESQRLERAQLAKRIHWLKVSKDHEKSSELKKSYDRSVDGRLSTPSDSLSRSRTKSHRKRELE